MSYMRDIVGRCYRVSQFPHGERRIKVNRYSIESRADVTTQTSFGWRLSCGHVLDGQMGHGKKRKQCYKCEWLAEKVSYISPEAIAAGAESWIDIPDEQTYEAIRQQAQS